jgi:hypothetical protein
MLKVPIGGIIMWSGTIETIPSNYHLCDGGEGTPDLMDWDARLPVGAGDTYAVGDVGGDWDRDAYHVHMSNFDPPGDESTHFHRFQRNFRTSLNVTCTNVKTHGFVSDVFMGCSHQHEALIITGPGSPHTHTLVDKNTLAASLYDDNNYPVHRGLYFIMRMS